MIGLTEYTFRLSPILSITSYIFIFFIDLKNGTLQTTMGRPAHISNAVHPDSYRDRGHFLFIADYLEDPVVTEKTSLIVYIQALLTMRRELSAMINCFI